MQLSTQGLDEYIQQRQNVYNEYIQQQHNDYNEYLQKTTEDFQNYRDSLNKAFADFLKKKWEIRTLRKEELITSPLKPIKPVLFNHLSKTPPVIIEAQTIHKIKLPEKSIRPSQKFTKLINDSIRENYETFAKNEENKIQFNFYDDNLNVSYNEMDIDLSFLNNETISNAWKSLSENDYLPLIYQLTNYAENYNLNDWGYLLIVRELANKIYTDNNQATLFTWFILFNTGYKNVKAGYFDKKLYIMIPSNMMVYNTSYYPEKGLNLYVFDLNNIRYSTDNVDYNKMDTISTYTDSFFGECVAEFDFFQTEAFNFNKQSKTNLFHVVYKDDLYKIPIEFNTQTVRLYNDYPLCEPQVYFRAPLSKTTIASLDKHIEPIIANMKASEKVQFLLTFTQKAFHYKLDSLQFGFERWQFPEEMFEYQIGDCEDRSCLFARLVKHFTNLKVIGLEYPGHIATAVCFNEEDIEGDAIVHEGMKYLICDPTHFFAAIGMCQEQYKNVCAKVIVFE